MPFSIERNDLATVEADAVVVAANEHLKITGGVGMAVARAAGLAELQAACDEIGFCPCGSAVATPAFNLKASVVVHAVGPVWMGGARGEADFLRSAYDAGCTEELAPGYGILRGLDPVAARAVLDAALAADPTSFMAALPEVF